MKLAGNILLMIQCICLVLILCCSASAAVRLPKIFSDNMVLQRERNIIFWGWASPNERITVQFNNQKKVGITGKDGKWEVVIGPQMAGGPYRLTVKGSNTISLNNIFIGDVWVCSGQSNMEWLVRHSEKAMAEMQQSNYPFIRHFKVPTNVASEPQNDLSGGEWKVSEPDNVGDFTAVGYFFAVELYKKLKVPIGLINTSSGGTNIETWISKKAFQESDEFKTMINGMPHMNLDSLANVKETNYINKVKNIQRHIEEDPDIIQSWKELLFNDSSWPSMNVPGLWEYQALADFDGVVWYRKTIELGEEFEGKEALLELAMINDSDDSYVNGVKVGKMSRNFKEKRKYIIPTGVLKKGKNVIAVRVEDIGGSGGIYGDSADLKLGIPSSSISLAGKWMFQVESIRKSSGISPNEYPSLLFNAMVSPLIPYSIKGAIWYQGESNADRAFQYRKSFPLLINDWRKQWSQSDFPFYFVQLSSYDPTGNNNSKGSQWAELREAQTLTLSLPNTGMAITTDIGNSNDIHPRNKQDVGKRLAAIALNKSYNENIVYSGPIYKSMKIEGNKIIISFNSTGSGLSVKDKYGYLKGFEIAGADKVFQYAKAYMEGTNIVVYSDGIVNPIAVRYGWADDAGECNLYNTEGFPAAPFRTDSWNGITENRMYGADQ
ncbi:MAG: sialate O-acetylesterase [Bacteroidota bacterium]|nr:sialate O-acetylesterase [Bacteroidota bacterium]